MKLKKEFIIVTIIIFFICGLEVITDNICEKSIDNIYKQIESVNTGVKKIQQLKSKNELYDEEKNKLYATFNNLKNDWFKEEGKLSFFSEHDELEKVSKNIVIVQTNLELEEYAIALEHMQEAAYWLNHFKEKDSVKLKNIF